jgi:hypothetical protein
MHHLGYYVSQTASAYLYWSTTVTKIETFEQWSLREAFEKLNLLV